MSKFEKKLINGWRVEAPSRRKNKKYDVYKDDEYITSFGDIRYQHYKDKFGYYKELDHLDKERRKNYRKRAKGISSIDDPYNANFWAYNYLWG
jgi:hypothetical protein